MQAPDNPSVLGPAERGSAPAHSPASTGVRPSGRAVVAVVATQPQTVLDDIQRAMDLAQVAEHLSPEAATLSRLSGKYQYPPPHRNRLRRPA